MSAYLEAQLELKNSPRTWLVTGAAGFIGSHLVETLLALGQTVVGIDDYSIGSRANLDLVRRAVGETAWERFRLFEGSINDPRACVNAVRGCDYVLHQAALSSVRQSIRDPNETHRSNVTGFLNVLIAARDSQVKRFVYASTAAVYGNEPSLPKQENDLGDLLSPYAVSKRLNEIYATNFHRVYQTPVVGLRYFNVFGPRQGNRGAVIPRWILSLLKGETVHINGSGEISRDFTYVANVVQLNILAALTGDPRALGHVFNGATSIPCRLVDLFQLLKNLLGPTHPFIQDAEPLYDGFSEGDIMHSCGDIGKARAWIGYEPTHTLEQGLRETIPAYAAEVSPPVPRPLTAPTFSGLFALS